MLAQLADHPKACPRCGDLKFFLAMVTRPEGRVPLYPEARPICLTCHPPSPTLDIEVHIYAPNPWRPRPPP